MKVKDYLKNNEKTPTYKYYFVVVLQRKHGKEERIINHEYDWRTKETAINKYLNCKIDRVENYEIPCSNFSLNGNISNYTEKGEKVFINEQEFLKANPKLKKFIEKEFTKKRFTL